MKFTKLHSIAFNCSILLNIQNLQGYNLTFLFININLLLLFMNFNLCDRTSISNITILDQKDRQTFEFRRLTHKMSNLARRIQKEKDSSKAQRSDFHEMQSKFNIIARTAQETIQKIESTNKKYQIKTILTSKTDESSIQTNLNEKSQPESDSKDLGTYSSGITTNEDSLISNTSKKIQEKQKTKKKMSLKIEEKDQDIDDKQVNRINLSFKKPSRITKQQLAYAVVFSMIICFWVRNSSFFI